ncbi:MAG TPA: aldo/keto reductase [Armatimonadota bacterium]
MKYGNFGKLDWKVSALGFGSMRLPVTDENPLGPNINEDEAIRMIRHSIDSGVNYVDTAYGYHAGKSEVVVGKALLDGYREKVKLATKFPVWLMEKDEDFDRILDEQLTRLQTDHIDVYMLHALNSHTWRDVVLKFDLLKKSEAALRDGRIRHLGFSFHDSFEVFEEILNGYDKWEFCQIQYNYMDTENQAGTKGLKLAAEKGLAVIVMEPLLGGKLADPPESVLSVLKAHKVHRNPADWALQWLWNQPEVSVVLSGMSNMAQVEENIRSAEASGVNSLDESDLAVIDGMRQKYLEKTAVPCTGCSYCMPCPEGVNIPGLFNIYNDAFIHDNVANARGVFSWFISEGGRPDKCIACRICEERCPQQIKISELMPKVKDLLMDEKG